MKTRRFVKSLVESIERQIEYWQKHIAEGLELASLVKSQLQQLENLDKAKFSEYKWCLYL